MGTHTVTLMFLCLVIIGLVVYVLTRKPEPKKKHKPAPEPPKKKKPPRKVDVTAKFKGNKAKKVEKDSLNHPLLSMVFRGHKGNIDDLHIRGDNSLMATVSADQTMRIWTIDPSTKNHAYKLVSLDAPGSAVRFSPDGTMLCVALRGYPRKLQFWDVKLQINKKTHKKMAWVSEAPTSTIDTTHTCDITTVEWGPGSNYVMSCARGLDTHINFWSRSGTLLQQVNSNQLQHNMAAFSADSRYMAVAARLADVKVWELSHNAANELSKVRHCMSLRGHRKAVNCLCFAANKIATVSQDGYWRVYDINVRYQLDEDPKLVVEEKFSEDSVDQLQISPNGSVLALSSGVNLIFYDLQSKQMIAKIATSRKGHITSMHFSADERMLAVGGGTKEVKLYKVPYPEANQPKPKEMKPFESIKEGKKSKTRTKSKTAGKGKKKKERKKSTN